MRELCDRSGRGEIHSCQSNTSKGSRRCDTKVVYLPAKIATGKADRDLTRLVAWHTREAPIVPNQMLCIS